MATPDSYIPRALEPTLLLAAAQFPAVVLAGPRQSGKTTLLKHLFGTKYRYLSVELPEVRAAASADPRGWLEAYPPPVIFDEIQHAPELLPYIKERIDAQRFQPGQYLLSGSQNLLLLERVTESLSGRTAVLRLLPLSRRETVGHPHAPLPWEAPTSPSGPAFAQLWGSLLRGGYPELTADPDRDLHLWHASYIQTYLERDVRSIRHVGDLSSFQAFLRALAVRGGQPLSLTDISRDLGVAVNTVKAWLSVLEATHQVFVLRPYFANVGKRLIKSPKVYFTDTGTLCHLVGLRDHEHAAAGPLGAAIFETAVLAEIAKTLLNRGQEPQLYFWRTSYGVEVDLVVDTGRALVPIEVKLSATPHPRMAAGIKSFQKAFGDRAAPGYIVHPGDVRLPLTRDITALPFGAL